MILYTLKLFQQSNLSLYTQVKEILAGDKQLAKEIEFDLRRFDQEQLTDDCEVEKEQRDQLQNAGEEDKNVGSGVEVPELRDKSSKDNDSSNPLLPDKQLDQELDNVPTPQVPVPVTPEISKDQLLRLTKAVTVARRMSVPRTLPLQEQIAETPVPKDIDDTHVDPRPTCTQEPTTAQIGKEKEKTHTPCKARTREELLRAVSTPHGEKSVINNITFIDETQELSAIGVDTTSVPDIDSAGSEGPKLLLHLKSPEAFAKECEFSRIRKTRRSLSSEPREASKNKKNKERRTTGGLYESYADVTESEAESLDDSDASASSVQSFSSLKASKKKKTASSEGKKGNNVKRNRDMASLSPDPSQTSKLNLAPTKKPIRKKSKSKK